jgi:hypothetical protein
MGRHYGVAIIPARPYKPQDKSKAELGVKGIQRWILMKLRRRTFFDVNELNDAISKLLDSYNDKVIRRLGKSRSELFAQLDKPSLHPLRANSYLFRRYKQRTVAVDYHIDWRVTGIVYLVLILANGLMSGTHEIVSPSPIREKL